MFQITDKNPEKPFSIHENVLIKKKILSIHNSNKFVQNCNLPKGNNVYALLSL